MPRATTFTISRDGEKEVPEFIVHERCWHEYGNVASVRVCLEEHRAALLERLHALEAILASTEPERAERYLFDEAGIQINEVTLRPPPDPERFNTLIRQARRAP